MDIPRPIRLPVIVPLEADQVVAELEAAIEVVARGAATRIVVSGLPELEAAAAETLVHAQAAGVRFTLSRDPATGGLSAVVGPREA